MDDKDEAEYRALLAAHQANVAQQEGLADAAQHKITRVIDAMDREQMEVVATLMRSVRDSGSDARVVANFWSGYIAGCLLHQHDVCPVERKSHQEILEGGADS